MVTCKPKDDVIIKLREECKQNDDVTIKLKEDREGTMF